MENTENKTMLFSEMAKLYCISRKTLQAWVSPIRQELLDMYPVKQNRLRILMPKQIKLIKEHLD